MKSTTLITLATVITYAPWNVTLDFLWSHWFLGERLKEKPEPFVP